MLKHEGRCGAEVGRPAYIERGHLVTAVGALATRPRAASTHAQWCTGECGNERLAFGRNKQLFQQTPISTQGKSNW